MTEHRRRLILIVAGSLIWAGGVFWLIVLSHVPRRLLATLLLLLVPPAIYLNVFGMRKMPWAALSFRMAIVGLLLITIGDGSKLLFGFEHPALGWVSSGGMTFLWLSMLWGLVASVRQRRKQDSLH